MNISVRRQCELIELNRSNLYYEPAGVNTYNLELMRLLDEKYTRTPFYGVCKMTEYLKKLGHHVNEKRVRRLLRLMGLMAIYPKPRLSMPNKDHKIFPYLLRDVVIDRINKVWSTDITYIRMKHGFIYLMAIIDWFSRYVLDWSISITLEADFCIETLKRVLSTSSDLCEIFNTDQGSQFTTPLFTNPLLDSGIKVSMDGRGRALDNIFVERLWRSVKYECVYLNDFETVTEAKATIGDYFEFYNHERFHQSLGYKTPAEVYFGEQKGTPSANYFKKGSALRPEVFLDVIQ